MSRKNALGAIFNLIVALALVYLALSIFSEGTGPKIAAGVLISVCAYFALVAALVIAILGVRQRQATTPPVVG